MTNRNSLAAFVLAACATPVMADAQTQQPVTAQGQRILVEQAAAQGGGRGRAIAPVETRVTPGRPYSAEAVTESLQVLGDGNRISKRSVTRVYRDNEGRMRREQLADNGLARTISISDPVGGASFTLDPSTKTAYRAAVLSVRQGTPVAGTVTSGSGGRRIIAGQATATRVEQPETSRSAAAQSKQVLEGGASGRPIPTRENLGEQTIEGVRATGTRTTTVIPAGSSLGNVSEIRIVSEQWFSPDLEVLVLTKHSDPRVGETTYKLVNIVRGQPDPNLFTVPADYTVQGRTIRNE